ncbi:MAG: VOC family protein [Candidatus Dormibacteria bacterium]
MLKFNNLMLGSENPAPLVEFYTKLLGEPTMSDGGYTGWSADGAAFLMIGQHSEVHGQSAEPARAIWFFETPDVKGEFERIRGFGARVVREPTEMDRGMWLATLADPDGNYFQLASPMGPPTD